MKISALYITNPVAPTEYLLTVYDDYILSVEHLYYTGELHFQSVSSENEPLSLFTCPGDIITELWSIEL